VCHFGAQFGGVSDVKGMHDKLILLAKIAYLGSRVRIASSNKSEVFYVINKQTKYINQSNQNKKAPRFSSEGPNQIKTKRLVVS
jgi:hypothetical protein